MQKCLSQALNFRRHGGREKHRLARERQEFADALNVWNKAHIQHTVSLINDQHFNAVHQQAASLKMIQQAAGCCDHHVSATVNFRCLRLKSHAAD